MCRDISAGSLCLQQEETGSALDRWNSLWPLRDLSSRSSSRPRSSVGNLPHRAENRRVPAGHICAAEGSLVAILKDIAVDHLLHGGLLDLGSRLCVRAHQGVIHNSAEEGTGQESEMNGERRIREGRISETHSRYDHGTKDPEAPLSGTLVRGEEWQGVLEP